MRLALNALLDTTSTTQFRNALDSAASFWLAQSLISQKVPIDKKLTLADRDVKPMQQ